MIENVKGVFAVHIFLITPIGVLCILRSDGYFGFPGGKVEKGEGIRDALEREFKEELGVDLPTNLIVEKTVNVERNGDVYTLIVAHTPAIPSGFKPDKAEVNEVFYTYRDEIPELFDDFHPIAQEQLKQLYIIKR
jgi:8-oxo-dGTP pyrophosphatase MutT (NUDIX family)